MKLNVISVSGPPGSGKSTLAMGLADALGCGVVGYDDFEVMTSWAPDAITAWLDDGAPMSAVSAPGLRDAILRHENCVIFETPFGKSCPVAGDLVTVSIWLECPDDIALARKLSALAAAGSGDRGFADWLGGWLSVYRSMTRRALKMQRSRIMPSADICLNGCDAKKNIEKDAIAHIRNRLAIN
ncbi:AAA family ATPase [Yoonia sediminilitoris]|uniref:Uridine kinase n=1 Tax=Yoonia sediminilitoris TaxID=1286148 RepID=A0A2T6KLN4_9RHOB|nr:hypothetical protein [Yoonia sediminilitoris]PUB17067.1 uridine kinase [Yoonia sediminilitoris]RCW97362.1 uridine kinase [Yoonia sediminilitoris]